jgi:hypothetical protein
MEIFGLILHPFKDLFIGDPGLVGFFSDRASYREAAGWEYRFRLRAWGGKKGFREVFFSPGNGQGLRGGMIPV